jgi:uncharacterized protein YsxB (DUF464 family)
MLEVTFYRDSRNRPSSIVALGHAAFAQHGQDVICAAVSAILQAARLGLEEYARIGVSARQEPGLLRLAFPEEARDGEALRAIIATAELSVMQIARQFPDHVRATTARAAG